MPNSSKNQPSAKGNRTSAAIDHSKLQSTWEDCFGDTGASALAEIVALAKQKRIQEWILEQDNYIELQQLLQHEIPKVRKNTARLMGQLKHQADLPLLIQASQQETTLFVVPSLLLAIGNFDSPEVINILQEATIQWQQVPETIENSKHLNEIHRALALASDRHDSMPACSFVGFPESRVLNIFPMHRCISILENETNEHLIPTKRIGEVLECPAQYSQDVQALRCAWMHLLPLTKEACSAPSLPAKNSDLTQWIKRLTPALDSFISIAAESFQTSSIYYRIELSNFPHTYRAALASQISAYIEQKNLIFHNSSTNYHIELRIEFQEKKQNYLCYLRSLIPPDERFSYRIGSLPASIHPVSAATLMRFSLPYLRNNARILDPCCGSGTLLIERAKIKPIASLVGIDRNNNALAIARENSKCAKQPAKFVGGRLETFQPDAPFDEVIANLPFGTRVGTHQSIQDLHRALFKRLPSFLNPEGIAILYSTQIKLMRQLATEYQWTILDQMQFDAGGLQPWGIILKRNDSKSQ